MYAFKYSELVTYRSKVTIMALYWVTFQKTHVPTISVISGKTFLTKIRNVCMSVISEFCLWPVVCRI